MESRKRREKSKKTTDVQEMWIIAHLGWTVVDLLGMSSEFKIQKRYNTGNLSETDYSGLWWQQKGNKMETRQFQFWKI